MLISKQVAVAHRDGHFDNYAVKKLPFTAQPFRLPLALQQLQWLAEVFTPLELLHILPCYDHKQMHFLASVCERPTQSGI